MMSLTMLSSSFNVCDRREALRETYRVEAGRVVRRFLNHRDLNDPIQQSMSQLLKINSQYGYGVSATTKELLLTIADFTLLFKWMSQCS